VRITSVLFGAALACAGADPGLLRLAPPESRFFSGIQVAQSLRTPFAQYVLAQMEPDDEGLRKLLSDAGIDLRRDIEEILIGTTGDSENSKSLIIARGQFHPAQFIAAATARGVSVANWHGIQVATLKGAKSEGAVAFVDPGIALLGDPEIVQAAIDRSAAASTLSPELQTRMRELSATYDAWFLSNGPPGDFVAGKLADENLGDAVHSNLLASVVEASGGLKFAPEGVRFTGTAVARSEKDARALRDVIKFIAGLVQVDKASKTTLAQSLQATAEGNVVRLSLSMPEAVVEQLFLKAQAGKADTR
jgi:hypothetical protein